MVVDRRCLGTVGQRRQLETLLKRRSNERAKRLARKTAGASNSNDSISSVNQSATVSPSVDSVASADPVVPHPSIPPQNTTISNTRNNPTPPAPLEPPPSATLAPDLHHPVSHHAAPVNQNGPYCQPVYHNPTAQQLYQPMLATNSLMYPPPSDDAYSDDRSFLEPFPPSSPASLLSSESALLVCLRSLSVRTVLAGIIKKQIDKGLR